MPSALSGTQKTNITAIDSAIGTALSSLTNGDAWQVNARAVLRQMRRLLEQIKVERSQ